MTSSIQYGAMTRDEKRVACWGTWEAILCRCLQLHMQEKRNETHKKGVGHRPGTLLHVGRYVPHTLVYGYVPPVHASVRTVVTRSHGLVSLGLLPETPPRSETTMQDGRWRDFFEYVHRITWLPVVRPGQQNVTVTVLVAPTNGVKRKDRFAAGRVFHALTSRAFRSYTEGLHGG